MKELIVKNWKLIDAPENLHGFWLTAEEIGKHLGYAEPRKSVMNIHGRHESYFENGKDVSVIKLMTEAGTRDITIFSERGTLKIIRYSTTEKSDKIMDEVFDVFLEVKKNGNAIMLPYSNLSITANDAKNILEADIAIAELLGCPKHLGQIEAVKHVKEVTGLDYSRLLACSKDMDKIEETEVFLEVSEIGERFGLPGTRIQQGKKINEFLAYIGWQTKDNGVWLPTKAGFKSAFKHAWKVGNKSGYNYKWNFFAVKKEWDKVQESKDCQESDSSLFAGMEE